MKKLRSILDNEKVYITAFWLLLAVVAIFFTYLDVIIWIEALSMDKWVETDCHIIESRVEEEGGKDWTDLFVVVYQYDWNGETKEANVYSLEYNGGSYYPDPNNLVTQYPIGSVKKCYVNPENPNQAVLEKESTVSIFFSFLVFVLFIISVLHLYATWNPAFAARFRRPPQTPFEAKIRMAWKPVKWIVIILGSILILSVGGILAIFFVFPLLFAITMKEQMKNFRNELVKLQIPQEGDHFSGSGIPGLNLTVLEKVIIVVAVTLFVLIMTFFIRHNKGGGLWALFGIMFWAIWFGLLITFVTYAVLRGMRQYRKDRSKKSTTKISTKAYYPPAIRVLKLAMGILALVGIGGFVAGFVCAFGTMSGKPRVSSWARFPLGDLESIAVDSEGNIYCGTNFYSRIQAYSPDGKFLRGWFIDASGGYFQIKIDDQDNLHVGTARGDHHYIFSTKGELFSVKEMSPKEETKVFGDTYYSLPQDSDGNVYKIRNGILLPRVIKITPKGAESVVVSDPFHLWFIKGPFPAFIWIVIALVSNALLERYKVPWHKRLPWRDRLRPRQ
jgi:hypothetical protein